MKLQIQINMISCYASLLSSGSTVLFKYLFYIFEYGSGILNFHGCNIFHYFKFNSRKPVNSIAVNLNNEIYTHW